MKIKDEVLEIDFYLPMLRYPSGEIIEFDRAVRIYDIYRSIEDILLNAAGRE